MAKLIIKDLKVEIDGKTIIEGLNLQVEPNTTCALMGRNGSGKSTLAYAIAGHPAYKISNGKILYNDKDITNLPPEERAKLGIFIAYQNPTPIPGLRVRDMLESMAKVYGKRLKDEELTKYLELLGWDASILDRYVHDGLSGGEKKRLEMLELMISNPSFMILDEIDSGLDVEALKKMSNIINELRSSRTTLYITHYQRFSKEIKPDKVCVMEKGKIVKVGDYSLVELIEEKGYDYVINN